MEATFVRFRSDTESKDIIMDIIDYPKVYAFLQDKEGTLEEWEAIDSELSKICGVLSENRSRELEGTPKDFELTGYPSRLVVDLSSYPSTAHRNKNDFVEGLMEYIGNVDMPTYTYHSPSEYEEGPTIACCLDYTFRKTSSTFGSNSDKFLMVFDWEVV